MKYQHYERYKVTAESYLPTLPEIFTSKEFNAMRDPIYNKIYTDWTRTRREMDKAMPNRYRNREEYLKWADKLKHTRKLIMRNLPISLSTLRAHNFIIIDHQEPITITVNHSVGWWDVPEEKYYYRDEQVSFEIYEAMKKYEPQNCRMTKGCEVSTHRNYYRINWDALNEYLESDCTEENMRLLATINELEKTLADLRKERKEKCPNWQPFLL